MSWNKSGFVLFAEDSLDIVNTGNPESQNSQICFVWYSAKHDIYVERDNISQRTLKKIKKNDHSKQQHH